MTTRRFNFGRFFFPGSKFEKPQKNLKINFFCVRSETKFKTKKGYCLNKSFSISNSCIT